MTGAARFHPLFVSTLLLSVFSTNANSQSTGRPPLVEPPPFTGTLTRPVTLGNQSPVTVVLKMAGDPVAVVRSKAPGKQISDGDRQAIEAALRSQQDAIVPAIQAIGAKVLAKFQDAINGIKVQATPQQIASLAKLPGIVAVKGVRTYTLDNAHSVPFIGAPQVWQGPPGLHGEHIRVAIIDTGIDYTHANFGGPGTVAAFKAASATSTQPADPALFGKHAPKVKGGIDLVGDAYNAGDPSSVPQPDPNPLDCNGHGSHTAGTAAGFGVTAAGNTYSGPYNAATPSVPFRIGPGVAPLADLYAVRVFGCAGSTNVVVEGIDWAVANDMQVISMSLGHNFGAEDDADAEAAENAANSGVVVVAASGNAGPVSFITSSPASGEKVISVAAMDSHDGFPAETLALSPGGSNIVVQDSNDIAISNGTSLSVVVLPDTKGTGQGGVSLGCDPAEYTAAGVTGKLVVVVRGTCARVDRAIYGQQAGAAAVAMINNGAGYPTFEGPILSNPDTGAPYTVTIPFLGVQGPPSGDGVALKAAASAKKLNTTLISNPNFRQFASFSSAGPRLGDGHLKPDITAPGVSVYSTLIGTGNQGVFFSGTSMATPHVAGSAALAIQAHRDWAGDQVAAAVVNTADAAQLRGYSLTRGGNGLVQPLPATQTSVIAHDNGGLPNLSFGVAEFTNDFSGAADITVESPSHSPSSVFSVSVVQGPGSSPHTVTVTPQTVMVSGGKSNTLHVDLAVPAAMSGDSSAFRQVQGQIVLTPTIGNNGAALSIPYYLIPRARSDIHAALMGNQGGQSVTVALNNASPAVSGTGDFYAWGLSGSNTNLGPIGLRALGVQSFTDPIYGQILVFAVNTFGAVLDPDTHEYDVYLDVDGDGVPDYIVVAADLGLLRGGPFSGRMAVAVFNLATNSRKLEFYAIAPTSGTTVLMPVKAADVGITSSNPRFSYGVAAFDVVNGSSDSLFWAKFNAFNSSVGTGAFAYLLPGSNISVPVSINSSEFVNTPALGTMVVSLENLTQGNSQAFLLPLSIR